jgi:PadR family transcriptional regulator, regulatory protein PadR
MTLLYLVCTLTIWRSKFSFSGGGKNMNKNLMRGAFLETVLLNLINESAESGLHGYAIFAEIKKQFGVNLGPSTLYPELKLLEKQQLIESSWEIAFGRARKKYKITRQGRGLLNKYFLDLKIMVPKLIG